MPLSAEQIALHDTYLGGSSAAVACGLSARMTARELFACMRKELPWPPVDQELSDLGHAFEPVARAWFDREAGIRFRPSKVTHWNKNYPFAMVHLDGMARGRIVGEYKMRAHTDGWGRTGTEEVPDDVMLQVQHAMAIKGPRWKLGYVVALFHGVDFRYYPVPRDQGLIDDLMAREHEFIERVHLGLAPDFDYEHPTTVALLEKLHPGTNGKIEYLTEADEHWAAVYNDAKARAREFNKAADVAKAHLLDQMGPAAIGMLPSGASFGRKRVVRDAYQVEKTSYFNFTYKRGAK